MRISTSRVTVVFSLALAVFGLSAQPPAAGTGTVEGDVVNAATRQGIAGARVRIYSPPGNPLFTTTDAQGHFQFTGLAFADYLVRADRPGFLEQCEIAYYEVFGNIQADLSATHQHETVQFPLRQCATVAGKVTEADGTPQAGASVVLLQQMPIGSPATPYSIYGSRILYYQDGQYNYFAIARVNADDIGEYRFPVVAGGRYYLAAQPSLDLLTADRTQRTTYYPRALSPAVATPIVLEDGKKLIDVDIRLIQQAGVRVTSRMVMPRGDARIAPPSPASVMELSSSQALTEFHSPDGAPLPGQFEFADVLPGKYNLEARMFDPPGNENRSKPALAGWRTLDVGSSDMNGVEVQLRPLFDLAASVIFEEGCQDWPAHMVLHSASRYPGGTMRSTVAADRTLVFKDLLPGKYTLGQEPYDPLVRATSARLGDKEVLGKEVELTGEATAPLVITMGCGGRVVVR